MKKLLLLLVVIIATTSCETDNISPSRMKEVQKRHANYVKVCNQAKAFREKHGMQLKATVKYMESMQDLDAVSRAYQSSAKFENFMNRTFHSIAGNEKTLAMYEFEQKWLLGKSGYYLSDLCFAY